MPEMFKCKIDRKKLLEEFIFKANSGAEYIDFVMIPSKDSKYGDTHFLVQSVSKEAREAGKKGPIIGNAKTLERKSAPAPKPAAPQPQQDADETVPF